MTNSSRGLLVTALQPSTGSFRAWVAAIDAESLGDVTSDYYRRQTSARTSNKGGPREVKGAGAGPCRKKVLANTAEGALSRGLGSIRKTSFSFAAISLRQPVSTTDGVQRISIERAGRPAVRAD